MRSAAPIIFLLTLALSGISAQAQPSSRAGEVRASSDYAADLDTLLASVLTPDGLVRYDLLRGVHDHRFRAVLKAIEDFDASVLRTHSERLAFWLNAYNVQMLASIVAAPEVREIVADGYVERFFRTHFRTAGLSMTLDQLEHVILRRGDGPADLERMAPERLDARIHVGLNCAALGCPRLQPRAFRPATVDRQLEAAMAAFVNDEHHFRREGRTWVFSSLIDWFATDFDAAQPAGDLLVRYIDVNRPDAASLRQLFTGRRAEELRNDRRIRFEYDWHVNAATAR